MEGFLERRGRLEPYRRLVVVCGMARTGTSALAAYLGSHPDVKPVVGGPLWHRMESDYVRAAVDWGFIDGVLKEFWPRMVLLKQPWLEKNVEFFERARGAKVLVCTRDFETLFSSWQQSPLSGGECGRKPVETYAHGLFCCARLMMKGALEVRKERMGPELSEPLGRFLGLRPEGFDPARISARWNGVRDKEWLEAKAIWRDKR